MSSTIIIFVRLYDKDVHLLSGPNENFVAYKSAREAHRLAINLILRKVCVAAKTQKRRLLMGFYWSCKSYRQMGVLYRAIDMSNISERIETADN